MRTSLINWSKYLNSNDIIKPKIIEDNPSSVIYTLDGNLIQIDDTGIDVSTLDDGVHTLTINAIDKFGLESSETLEFTVDTIPPSIELLSNNNTAVSKRIDIQVSISDKNLSESDYLLYLLPNGERIVDQKSYSFDTSNLDEGKYIIEISAQDKTNNIISSKILFEVDYSTIDLPKSSISADPLDNSESDNNNLFMIIIGIVAGLLFFPSPDFSKSILVGILFPIDFFPRFMSQSLLFLSFLIATFVPIFTWKIK